MPKSVHRKSSSSLTVIIIAAIIAAVAVGFWLMRGKEAETIRPERPAKPEKIHVAVKNRPTIDYQRMQQDETLKAEMEKRKAEYGVDKGLDFILKADESLKIGGLTVPMEEILEKIRIKKGDIVENDLAARLDMEKLIQERKTRINQLTEAEKRYAELEKLLQDPAVAKNREKHETYAAEQADLAGTVALFKRYKETLNSLAETRKHLADGDSETRASARTTLHTLKSEIEKLERLLGIPRIPEKHSEAYGIYVVRKGDNIWNIHFKFLKDYFAHRRIALAPMSDEPDSRGFSSGVGKILKFSENMVYIYNLKEHKLDVDLNLLQPLSKIVVFNMGEVLRLLDPIDYSKVNRIRFDGETLWIPAEQ